MFNSRTWFALAGLWLATVWPLIAAPAARPNVIIIMTDDQGSVDAGCYGSKDLVTPAVDSLAAHGVRFTQFYSAAPVCSPSRAGLLTGRYPWLAGMPNNGAAPPTEAMDQLDGFTGAGLPAKEVTIAKMFQSAGYATAHLGKWHLGGGDFLPQYQGFDTNIAGGETGHPASYFWPYGRTNDSHRVPDLATRGGVSLLRKPTSGAELARHITQLLAEKAAAE